MLLDWTKYRPVNVLQGSNLGGKNPRNIKKKKKKVVSLPNWTSVKKSFIRDILRRKKSGERERDRIRFFFLTKQENDLSGEQRNVVAILYFAKNWLLSSLREANKHTYIRE